MARIFNHLQTFVAIKLLLVLVNFLIKPPKTLKTNGNLSNDCNSLVALGGNSVLIKNAS